ncbi:methyltransferase domain-containing protein [Falsiroseomonas sp.]|uniref:methyltransferase domain-containing protein n=1 Tax=Falsiroseomonas sp. TaxID=2870721 RepID=UPI0034A4CD0F
MTSIEEKWEAGKANELRFWESLFPEGGQFSRDALAKIAKIYHARLETKNKIEIPELSPLISRIQKKELQTLEVGPGPIPRLGIIKTEKHIIVNTLDPLTEEYLQMMRSRDIDISSLFPRGRFVSGMAEKATEYFDIGSMDLIYCSNALDHCADPIAAVRSLFEICAPGGAMYLSGLEDEGEYEKYSGFHQWNLKAEGDNLTVWRPDARYALREALSGDYYMRCYSQDRGIRRSWHVEISKAT